MGDHAMKGPSSLSRRLTCLGSLEAEDGFPEEPASVYAAEGTKAHQLLENKLLGLPYESGNYPDEMHRAVDIAVAWTQRQTEKGYVLFVETRVDPVDYLNDPDCWGTADIILVNDDHLIVADFKYGRGVIVNVEGNHQLAAYAAGAVSKHFPFAVPPKITTAIIQSRTPGDPIKTLDPSYVDLAKEWAWIRDRLVFIPGGVRTPGADQCKFCKARFTCVARKEAGIEATKEAFAALTINVGDPISQENIESMSPGELSEILDYEAATRALFGMVRHQAESVIVSGLDVPGYKMVSEVGRRAWALEEEDLAKKFKSMKLTLDEYSPREILDPAGIEKIAKLTDKQRGNLAKLWTKKIGKPSLVVSTDDREGIVYNSAEAFKDIAISDDEAIEILTDTPVSFI